MDYVRNPIWLMNFYLTCICSYFSTHQFSLVGGFRAYILKGRALHSITRSSCLYSYDQSFPCYVIQNDTLSSYYLEKYCSCYPAFSSHCREYESGFLDHQTLPCCAFGYQFSVPTNLVMASIHLTRTVALCFFLLTRVSVFL